MKKLVLIVITIFMGSLLHAWSGELDNKWGVLRTSYTQGATPGAILFTSATIRLEAVNVIPAPGALFAFFRSTTGPVFKFDISTWTEINVDTTTSNPGGPLYGIESTSFTYINRVGESRVTIIFRCKDWVFQPYDPVTKTGYNGLCPGLPWSGNKGRPSQGP